jgi:hypothetical protein
MTGAVTFLVDKVIYLITTLLMENYFLFNHSLLKTLRVVKCLTFLDNGYYLIITLLIENFSTSL